ncbi:MULTISPECIES: cytochrome bd oxidase small subunit CydS [Oceanobacillus]
MLNDFLIFVAPFIMIIVALLLSFWAALKDDPVPKKENN